MVSILSSFSRCLRPTCALCDEKRLSATGAPQSTRFDAIERPRAADLPAVRWKLINLAKLKKDNPGKHAEQRGALEALLS